MELPPPAFPPFTFHWKDGVNPPPLGFALKVTEPPEQKGFCEEVIVMLTGVSGVTVTGYWILGTGLVIVHISEDVKVQETRSPLTGVNV